jgi:hypothetical protein
MIKSVPSDGIAPTGFPINRDHRENSLCQIVIPKPQAFIAMGLQLKVLVLLESNEKVFDLELVQEIDRNGW